MWLDGPQANIIIYADGPSGLERTRDSLSMLVAHCIQAHHVTLPTAEINRSQPRLAFCFRILLLCRTGNAAGGSRPLVRPFSYSHSQPAGPRCAGWLADARRCHRRGTESVWVCTRGSFNNSPTHQPYLQHQQVILNYCKHTYIYLPGCLND